MTLEEFTNKYDDKYVEVGGSPTAMYQCVDLANQYLIDVVGHEPILGTNADDFPSKCMDFCDWYQDGVPEPGDMIIWDMGSYGHIAIFVSGNSRTFTSFDQNYPLKSPCHYQEHGYNYVIGWLRPKGDSMTEAKIKRLIFTILEHEWRLMHDYQEPGEAGNASIQREIDELYQQWAGNEWAFAPKQDQWFKESGLTKPANCDSILADTQAVWEKESIQEMQEHADAMSVADKRIKNLEANISHLEEKLGQELSGIELIKLGFKKLWKKPLKN